MELNLEGEFQPFAFGASIFEPKLDVLGLQFGEFEPVGLPVELVGVAQDQRVRRMRVHGKPVLQTRHLRHGVYKRAIALATVIAAGQAQRIQSSSTASGCGREMVVMMR